MEELDRLMELHGKATQGEWMAMSDEICIDDPQPYGLRYPVIAGIVNGREKWFGYSDLEYIAAMHNSLPAIYERFREMEKENAELRERCEAAEMAMSDIVDGASRCDFCQRNPNTCGTETVYSCGGFEWRGPQSQEGAEHEER
jgi:hypothetical protein